MKGFRASWIFPYRSRFRHLALRFWNQTCKCTGGQGGSHRRVMPLEQSGVGPAGSEWLQTHGQNGGLLLLFIIFLKNVKAILGRWGRVLGGPDPWQGALEAKVPQPHPGWQLRCGRPPAFAAPSNPVPCHLLPSRATEVSASDEKWLRLYSEGGKRRVTPRGSPGLIEK